MIKWCSYCQKFMGQKAPFEDYDITHRICQSCKDKKSDINLVDPDKTRKFKDYFHKFFKTDAKEIFENRNSLIQEGHALGIDSISLFFGIIQPMMQKLGHNVSDGKASIVEEHIFTSIVESLVSIFEMECNEFIQSADVLIINSKGNTHTLGTRTLALALNEQKIKAVALIPVLPIEELRDTLCYYPKKLICVSIATETQADEVQQTVDEITNLNLLSPPRIAVGGYGTKYIKNELKNVDFVHKIENHSLFFNFVKRIINS